MEKFEYLNELQVAAEKMIQSYGVIVMVTLFFRWTGSFAAVLLMILDRTKWKSTNMWTSLLAPYLFCSLPLVMFQFFRGDFGKWIALLTVVLRLFLPKHILGTQSYQENFAESLEIPGTTLLLIVTAPSFFVEIFRDQSNGLEDPVSVCLLTSCYLINNHTKACGGYKNSFTQKDKLTCTICLYLLFVYPLWSSFTYPFIYI